MPIDISQPARAERSAVARDAVRYARGFVQYCQDASATIRTNPMSANWVKQTIDMGRDAIVAINALAGDAQARGDLAYMFEATQAETNAKFTAVRNAAVNIRDWCISALPKDADGNLLLEKRDAEGAQTVFRFEIGTLVPLADLMDAYLTAART